MMQSRRQFFRATVRAMLATAGIGLLRSGASVGAQRSWVVRAVGEGDGAQLLSMMQSCVSEGKSFFGPCSPLEWTDTWVKYVIGDRPNSIVVTYEGQVVAYVDVPGENPGPGSHAPYRNAFWCGAAGVSGELAPETAAVVFRHAVWEALRRAQEGGYERVRCAAPWLQHPAFGRAFPEYPGLTVDPFYDDRGRYRYLIEWDLEAAVGALAGEGASGDLNAIFA
jgi:hypothetical protein